MLRNQHQIVVRFKRFDAYAKLDLLKKFSDFIRETDAIELVHQDENEQPDNAHPDSFEIQDYNVMYAHTRSIYSYAKMFDCTISQSQQLLQQAKERGLQGCFETVQASKGDAVVVVNHTEDIIVLSNRVPSFSQHLICVDIKIVR
jgi:hypothetical protein